jgi:hypothetical protein
MVLIEVSLNLMKKNPPRKHEIKNAQRRRLRRVSTKIIYILFVFWAFRAFVVDFSFFGSQVKALRLLRPAAAGLAMTRKYFLQSLRGVC